MPSLLGRLVSLTPAKNGAWGTKRLATVRSHTDSAIVPRVTPSWDWALRSRQMSSPPR